MFDDKEAVQQPERQRRQGKEIEGHDGLLVVLQKRQPLLTRVASALNSTQIPGDSPLRDSEDELRHVTKERARSPARVLLGPYTNQPPDFAACPIPTPAAARLRTWVPPEARTVPANDG